MPLSLGSRLGPYEVVGAIGAGGMGEVYRARDVKLHRDVAIKILPEIFARDAERLARFSREAQVLASLNHPGIAHVYGVEDSPAGPALVMEMVDGPTLAEVVAKSRMSVADALVIARHIADALEAAHEHGVIHRDLKPANIKVKDDGTVKVLDFGLAKAVEPSMASTSGELSNSPTLTSPAATALGMILGTAAYMAPEQARGKSVDKRADIWAFGCVLYEMLTRQRPFAGEDVAETIGAVIHKEPDWAALPPDTSHAVRSVLDRCLRKDPKQRLRDIGDVRLILDGAFETSSVSPAATAKGGLSWRAMLMFAAVVLALIIATAFSVWRFTRPPALPVVKLTAIHPGPDAVGGGGGDIVVSPDGKKLVYLAGQPGQKQIYVRALDQLTVTRLGAPGTIPSVFLSPDGQWVGFIDVRERSLKKISIDGGAALTICDNLGVIALSPTWGESGRIVFAENQANARGLWSVSAAGGTPERVLAADEKKPETFGPPAFLPGGRALLFGSAPGDQGEQIDSYRTEVLDLATGARTELFRGGSSARYVSSGHIVYATGDSLQAVRFDLDHLRIVGSPVRVTEGVFARPNGIASVSVSDTGTLAYIRGGLTTARRSVVWVDRQGREEDTGLPPRAYAYARISPDESRLALDVRDEERDIWIWDLRRKTFSRLTFDPGINRAPVWTPDGQRVAFSVAKDAAENVYWQPADGSRPAEPLTKNQAGALAPRMFSPDGEMLIVGSAAPPFDLEILHMHPEPRLEPLLTSSFDETEAAISPDGRWLAYQSNESGPFEIYVRPFPAINAGRWLVSNGGGTRPLWSRNGRELFYSIAQGYGSGEPNSGTLMSVPIQPGPTFRFGSPTRVVQGPYIGAQAGRHYDVSRDGRFLMIKDARPSGELPPPEIIVVQNWFEELKRLVP